jgi:hypothetical protein
VAILGDERELEKQGHVKSIPAEWDFPSQQNSKNPVSPALSSLRFASTDVGSSLLPGCGLGIEGIGVRFAPLFIVVKGNQDPRDWEWRCPTPAPEPADPPPCEDRY